MTCCRDHHGIKLLVGAGKLGRELQTLISLQTYQLCLHQLTPFILQLIMNGRLHT